jgi:hypothetical protein
VVRGDPAISEIAGTRKSGSANVWLIGRNGAPKYSTHENWDWGSRTQTIDDYYKSQPKWMM